MLDRRKNSKAGFVNMKIVGIGGGGNSVVNTLIDMGLSNADFIALDTDAKKLISSVASKHLLLDDGDGTGGSPQIGEQTAKENYKYISEAIKEADLVFIIACMGGGTGTGVAPVVASCARDIGALTVSIVTKPFAFEGAKRISIADTGIDILKKNADTSIVIDNERLWSIMDDTTTISDAFDFVNKAISQIVKVINYYIKPAGIISMDFSCIKSMLKDSGQAIIGIGEANGENRILTAVKSAMKPILENHIQNAGVILMNVIGNSPSLMDLGKATDAVREVANSKAEIICNVVNEKTMDERVLVAILASKFRNS